MEWTAAHTEGPEKIPTGKKKSTSCDVPFQQASQIELLVSDSVDLLGLKPARTVRYSKFYPLTIF